MKNHKTGVVVIALLFFTVCSVFASNQMFYKDSDEIKRLESLARVYHVTLPVYIYPVSGDTLVYYINHSFNMQNMSQKDSIQLQDLIALFSGEKMAFKLSEDFAFSPDISVAPAFMFNTEDPDTYFSSLSYAGMAGEKSIAVKYRDVNHQQDQIDWVVAAKDVPAFLVLGTDLKLSKFAFGHFEYELSCDPVAYHRNRIEHNMLFEALQGKLESNGTAEVRTRNSSIPYHVYLSAGIPNINFAIGRMRLSSGNGITGNMGIGDNFRFRQAFVMTLNAYPFTYQYMLNRFDSESKEGNYFHSSKMGSAVPWITIHKANIGLFKSKLNFGLYEGELVYSEFDPKILSPFTLLHNWMGYRNGNENNFFGVEIDYTTNFGLSLEAQGFFDQIQLSAENKSKPNAFGLLANAKYSISTPVNIVTFYAEGVYTNPWLYMKSAYDENSKDLDGDYASNHNASYHQNDLIVGNYTGYFYFDPYGSNQNAFSYTDTAYMGYKYGPNTVLGDFGVVIESKSNTLGLDFMVKASGENWMDTSINKPLAAYCGQSGDDAMYDSNGFTALSPYVREDSNKKAQVLLQLRFNDKLVLCNGAVVLNGVIAYQHYSNFECIKNNNHANVQAMASVCFRPLKFAKTSK